MLNTSTPRTIRYELKDGPAPGDDIPCEKCGEALDTGLECTECGYDMAPKIYKEQQ